MKPRIRMTIGRRFDNRDKGEDDDSPLAWELHRMRGRIVHEELGRTQDWTVVHWGDTDDEERTHEDVTVLIELAEAAKTVALGFGGAVLYRVLEDTVVDAIKNIVRKFVPRLRKKEITRAYITLSDGTSVEWQSPGYEGDVSLSVYKTIYLSEAELEG